MAADEIDLDALALICQRATDGADGRWGVSRSNGTITSHHVPTEHASTVAFAIATDVMVMEDEKYAKIDIDENDARFIESACPAVVLKLITRLRGLEAHQELYLKELEVARSLTDPQVAEHFRKERYELMGMLAVLKLLVRKLTAPPFATDAPLTDDEIRELLRAHGFHVKW